MVPLLKDKKLDYIVLDKSINNGKERFRLRGYKCNDAGVITNVLTDNIDHKEIFDKNNILKIKKILVKTYNKNNIITKLDNYYQDLRSPEI